MLCPKLRRSAHLIFSIILAFCRIENDICRRQFFLEKSVEKVVSLLVKFGILIAPFFLLSVSVQDSFAGKFDSNPRELYRNLNNNIQGDAANSLLLTLTATNVACYGGNNGSIASNLSGGSGGTVNYTLTPGSVTNTTGIFPNLIAGAYTVLADDGGITASSTINITEPVLPLSSSISAQTNIGCKGNSTGSLTVSGNGGTTTYSFSKDTGVTYQGSGTFASLSAGSYTIKVKDANGCTVNQAVTITEPAVLLGATITSQTNVSCKGGATGSVTVTGTGGTAIYQYSKNGGTTYQASGTFGTLGAGVYTIRVKDANGCTFDQPVTISEPAVALGVTSSSNSPVCTNATLNLSATGNGGTGSYIYNWTGPNSFTSASQNPAIVNPTTAASGNYSVTITDANNCTANIIVSVTINAAPTVMVNASINSICAGGSVTLTSSSNIPPPPSLPPPVLTATNSSTGGTPALAAWTVKPDGYITNGLTFHSNDLTSFYLSDSHSQDGTITSTILQTQAYNTVGYSSLTLDFWHYFRFNGSTNESAKVQISLDGTTWTTLATYTSTLGTSTGFVNANFNLNSYVNKPQLYVRFFYYSGARARYWVINNVSLTGTSTAVSPTVSWSSNPAGFSSSVANPPTVNPNVTTAYTATYTNPTTGCSNSASTTVMVIPSPVITIQPNYCAVPGKVRLTASGGTTYTWTTGETTNPIFTDIANTYGVSSTNAFGCTGSAFLPVANELVTNGDFSVGNTGFSSTYGYVPVSTNALWPEGLYGVGPNPTAYHSNFWGRDHTTNSGNFMIVNGTGLAGVVVWQETVTVLPNTPYYFSAWAMSLNSVPPYANLQFNVNGTLVGTTAPLAARPNNNNPPYNWQRFYGTWNSGSATTAIIQIVDLQTALGGNDFGLDDVSFGTLAPIPFTISPTVNPTAIACSGKTMYLKANLAGGRAPITYTWTGPNGFTSTVKDPIIPNTSEAHSGLYSLSVVDGYGCDPVIGTVNATILPSPNPTISSINGSGIVCPFALEKYWTTPTANVTNSWSVAGGSIVGSVANDSINIQWGATGSGLITLTAKNIVNNCDSTITKSILVQDLIPPIINCPPTLNLSGSDETAITVNPYSATLVTIQLSQLILAGGSASDICGLASITYLDTKSGTNLIVVNRTYSAIDFAGNISSCAQIINISDNVPPTLVVPLSYAFCVDDLLSAAMVANVLKINPAPDYFLFKKGSPALDLNPAGFSDNLTPINQLILHWQIDFSPTTLSPSISGTGQPSTYPVDIVFPGDGITFTDLSHTINYWVVDLNGNESVHKSVPITIHPRPVVSGIWYPLFPDYVNTKLRS